MWGCQTGRLQKIKRLLVMMGDEPCQSDQCFGFSLIFFFNSYTISIFYGQWLRLISSILRITFAIYIHTRDIVLTNWLAFGNEWWINNNWKWKIFSTVSLVYSLRFIQNGYIYIDFIYCLWNLCFFVVSLIIICIKLSVFSYCMFSFVSQFDTYFLSPLWVVNESLSWISWMLTDGAYIGPTLACLARRAIETVDVDKLFLLFSWLQININ